MAKTLPAQAATERKKTGRKVTFLIDFSAAVSNKYWATRNIAVSGTTYLDRIKSMSPSVTSINRLGGIGERGGYSITLVNGEDDNSAQVSDMLNGAGVLTNSEVNIKIIFDDGTALDINEAVTIFNGKVWEYELRGQDTLKFTFKSNEIDQQDEIEKILQVIGFPDAPKDTVGEVFPSVYGLHNYDLLSGEPLLTGNGPISPLQSSLLMRDDGSVSGEWRVGNILDAINRVWLWEELLSQYVLVDSSSFTVTLNAAGGTKVGIEAGALCFAYLRPTRRAIPTTSDITDAQRILDSDLSTNDGESRTVVGTNEVINKMAFTFEELGSKDEDVIGTIDVTNGVIVQATFDVKDGFDSANDAIRVHFLGNTIDTTTDYTTDQTSAYAEVNATADHITNLTEWDFSNINVGLALWMITNVGGSGLNDGRTVSVDYFDIRLKVKYVRKGSPAKFTTTRTGLTPKELAKGKLGGLFG